MSERVFIPFGKSNKFLVSVKWKKNHYQAYYNFKHLAASVLTHGEYGCDNTFYEICPIDKDGCNGEFIQRFYENEKEQVDRFLMRLSRRRNI